MSICLLRKQAQALRQQLPAHVWIYANECKGIHYVPHPHRSTWVSPHLDIVSVDYYAKPTGTGNTSEANEAGLARAYYKQYIFPYLLPQQRVAVVPGMFAAGSGNVAQQDGTLAVQRYGLLTRLRARCFLCRNMFCLCVRVRVCVYEGLGALALSTAHNWVRHLAVRHLARHTTY